MQVRWLFEIWLWIVNIELFNFCRPALSCYNDHTHGQRWSIITIGQNISIVSFKLTREYLPEPMPCHCCVILFSVEAFNCVSNLESLMLLF